MTSQDMLALASDDVPNSDGRVIRARDASPSVGSKGPNCRGVTLEMMNVEWVVFGWNRNFGAIFALENGSSIQKVAIG